MARLNFRWPFLLAVLSTLLATSAPTDTMNPGDTVTDAKSLMSADGGFRLGFFTPGNSTFRYLGIWYGTISPQQTVIWVANRARGINDSTGVLSFHGNGSLVLSDARGDVYWSTGAAAGVASPVARLLDNANFMVINDSGGGAPAWQSFDYPTDTLLPGMKLGWDLRTGRNRNITSWRSPDDPAPGQYSMVLDVRGVPQLIFMLDGATPLWSSGPWVGQRFSGSPETSYEWIFNFSFHNGADEVYYRFDTLKDTILSRLVAQPTGVVERVVWVEGTKSWNRLWSAPNDQCDTFSTCGPFGVCDSNRLWSTDSPKCSCPPGFDPGRSQQPRSFSDGCARRTALDCRNGTDGFVKVMVDKLPDTSAAVANPTMGLDECRAACLRNCSCTAYSNAEVTGGGTGCVLWAGDLTGLRQSNSEEEDLYVRVAAADLVQSRSSNSKRVLAVGAVLCTVVLGWICWFLWRRRRKTTTERVLRKNVDVVAAGSGTKTTAVEDLDDLPLMDFTSIAAATDGFSAENKLGEGGFGPVYMGRMGDGHEVAVKRLARNSAQGLHEFKNEVVLIAKLQHRNLVRLLGCCIQGDEKILVYEYMPNKSLDAFLFGLLNPLIVLR